VSILIVTYIFKEWYVKSGSDLIFTHVEIRDMDAPRRAVREIIIARALFLLLALSLSRKRERESASRRKRARAIERERERKREKTRVGERSC